MANLWGVVRDLSYQLLNNSAKTSWFFVNIDRCDQFAFFVFSYFVVAQTPEYSFWSFTQCMTHICFSTFGADFTHFFACCRISLPHPDNHWRQKANRWCTSTLGPSTTEETKPGPLSATTKPVFFVLQNLVDGFSMYVQFSQALAWCVF